MPTLVVVESRSGAATVDSLALLGLAREIDADVRAAIIGFEVGESVEEASGHGASTVYVLDDQRLEGGAPEPQARIVAQLVREHAIETVLLPTSSVAADVAAALAVELEAGLNWDLTALAVEGDRVVGRRLAFGDALALDVGWRGTPRIGLVRPGVATPHPTGERGGIVPIEVDLALFASGVEVTGGEPLAESDNALEDAEIVVAAGKGLGAKENLAHVEALARELGGAVGVTRAVVELGWYPQSAQIGQTGKTVSPRLYIACGISGAIHHKFGMQTSETIVAINTDRSAPIFDFCDLGIVGDATTIVPSLTELLRARGPE